MKHKPIHSARFFFTTSPLPCPYIVGREERRVVTELVGRAAIPLHDALSLAGYRRSHSIAYAPACPSCDACVAVRVLVNAFRPSRSQRRVLKANEDLQAMEVGITASEEQYDLFAAYQISRHGNGDMAKMDYFDYVALVEDTTVETTIVEFRHNDFSLAGACIVDRIHDGLSAVYSFFDPTESKRSLGVYMILWLISRSQELGLSHAYLGFWIADCPKMSYKSAFKPMEGFSARGWRLIEGE